MSSINSWIFYNKCAYSGYISLGTRIANLKKQEIGHVASHIDVAIDRPTVEIHISNKHEKLDCCIYKYVIWFPLRILVVYHFILLFLLTQSKLIYQKIMSNLPLIGHFSDRGKNKNDTWYSKIKQRS